MKVCFFGIYDKNYSRNSVLIDGFSENGYEVFHCHVDPRNKKGIDKYFSLYKEYKKIKHNKFDKVLVLFPGHSVVWLARILFGKRFLFDFFLSTYNSAVEDRKLFRKFSIKGILFWLNDWLSLSLSKNILIDTKTHKKFISKKFKVRENKFTVVYVGSNDKIVYPKERRGDDIFNVHFHGVGTPMQGFNVIKEAAKILESNEDIKFSVYGLKGENTKNVFYHERFPYENISDIFSNKDIVLGIFGDTIKAQNVIPNKVYEGLAAKKVVITLKTPAILELFENENHMLLCDSNESKELVEKLIMLRNNKDLRDKISSSGYKIFKQKLTPKNIVEGLLNQYE